MISIMCATRTNIVFVLFNQFHVFVYFYYRLIEKRIYFNKQIQ
jgi:hypothetical protein